MTNAADTKHFFYQMSTNCLEGKNVPDHNQLLIEGVIMAEEGTPVEGVTTAEEVTTHGDASVAL